VAVAAVLVAAAAVVIAALDVPGLRVTTRKDLKRVGPLLI
jgi:hypothetical protein